MVISAIATATMPPATSSTRTMLPPRRAGSWAVIGSRDESWSVSAVMRTDVADNFGDRMIMFHRDLLVDLDGGMQRPRQRHVLDDGDIVRAGDFPDLERDRIDPLGHADRRRHASLV